MKLNELIDQWLRHHNEKYTEYMFNEKEPRWHTKQFFLYSYRLLLRLGHDRNWEEYIERYKDLFRRDPSNDYYGRRSPVDPERAWDNSLEWANIFELVGLVGFPYNESAKEKMLKNAYRYLEEAKSSMERDCHDIMICSAVKFLPKEFEGYREWLLDWISKYISTSDPTPHQIIAYLSVIEDVQNHEDLRERLLSKLLSWIKSPTETARRQILIWARLSTRLNLIFKFLNSDIQKLLKENFFKCLEEIHSIEWHNLPIILEAAYKLSDPEVKESIQDKVSRRITPSRFFKFKEIFPFLDEKEDYLELQNEIETIKEKCRQSPSRELCMRCMKEPQGECWIRILAKVTGTTPWTHSPFEVADVVIYTLDKGIYFVIKANPITQQRGEGDVLYRQCTQLFSNDHALVLYLNPHDTAPAVIEKIRTQANSMATNPRFEVVDKKYIRQIYRRYKEMTKSAALSP